MSNKKSFTVVILPGEGIGPEVIAHAMTILQAVLELENLNIVFKEGLIGQKALDATGFGLPIDTLNMCKNADAILFGAVSKHGLLELRSGCNFFANLRPVKIWPELLDCSTLKSDTIAETDILFVRELVGGLYFGPSGVEENNGNPYAYHTMQYYDYQIRQIAQVAFEQAQKRSGSIVLAHKENALPKIRWCSLVAELATEYPNIVVQPMLVDTVAMELVREPKQFDTILSGNMFGDILSDIGAGITGSIGLLPSASLNGNGQGMYEAIHGTAPQLVGKNRVNPTATIMSVAMLLGNWGYNRAATRIEQAVRTAINDGFRTADIATNNNFVSSSVFTEAIVERLPAISSLETA